MRSNTFSSSTVAEPFIIGRPATATADPVLESQSPPSVAREAEGPSSTIVFAS